MQTSACASPVQGVLTTQVKLGLWQDAAQSLARLTALDPHWHGGDSGVYVNTWALAPIIVLK